MKRSLHGAVLFLCAVALHGATGREFERGFPLIEVQNESRHGAGSQLFSVAQDPAGMLYVGALAGVGVYDGAWWKTIALPNDSAVFAVAGGSGPEVAVGAIDEFGWVAPDPHGTVVYHSLLQHLPKERRALGDVRSICAMDNGFLYAAERAIVLWTGGAARIIADPRGRTTVAPPRCFRAGKSTYVALDDGLHRLENDTLVRAGFDGQRIDLVLPYDEQRDLVLVRNEGIFLDAAPFAPEASAWLKDKIVTAGCVLKDGRIVIGTRQDGIAILDRGGAIEQRLDTNADLPDAVLSGALADREGSLWLTYYGSIARVDLDAAMSVLDKRRGVRGAPSDAERHRDRLYIATSHGLFVIDRSGTTRAVPGIPGPVWRAISAGDDLVVGTGDGLFILDRHETVRRVSGTESLAVYFFAESPSIPNRWWISTKRGTAILDRDARGWRFGGFVPGMPPYGRHVVEHEGELWSGSVFDGITRLDLATNRITKYGSSEMDVALVRNAIVLVNHGQLLVPRPDGTLVPHPLLGHLRGGFDHVEEDSLGNVWMDGASPAVVTRLPNGSFARDPRPLVGVGTRISDLDRDDDVMWLSSASSFFRVETSRPHATPPQPRPLIRRTVLADGTPVVHPLPHAFGRLHIEFAPVSYRPGAVYQYRLDPADREWSAWTAEPHIDYTNLDPGEYTFRVRSRGASGQVSAESQRSFVVLPPWYRTRFALALWIVLAALVVAIIVRLRTAALRRQAERLRLLVQDQTEELQAANAHLERLSLLDDLTGIANRRYFQRALVEDWRSAHESGQPLALLLLDLDRFKQLNDEHGHPAGDAALVQVARYLAREIRRSGELGARLNDLVARIGGEEFAIVLTNTSEEEALRTAERLRAGIEALPIVLRESKTIHTTASCGAASIVPQTAEGWNALMQETDRALYEAKAAGRNCVRGASGSAVWREASSS
ncbi:MAG TPA: diguanylate cyclase [Thermoanaerobaculia bacterium]|nr:diguanylate cyclase [Thermoanaerobaculia bacterium]